MAQNAMTKSSPRLLLNAEPFGFGPTAAIASFFPHLREEFSTIGYVGKHHTLDLQRSLPYDNIHDVSCMEKDERAEVLLPIFEQYDVFLSAMDYKMVELAQQAGLKVFYYDALSWCWPEIAPGVQKADIYMGQNFFGVEERLKEVFGRSANAYTVSPIVPVAQTKNEKEHILINLGGLQNPFWPVEDIVVFAERIIDIVMEVIPENETIKIAQLANGLSENDNVQDALRMLVAQAYAALCVTPVSHTSDLIERFGSGGEKQVADLVIRHSCMEGPQ